MAKETKQGPRPVTVPQVDTDPFKQFLRDSLDRVVEESLDVQESAAQVRNDSEQRVKEAASEFKSPQPAPVYLPPPDLITEEVMKRRFLPMSHLNGNEVPQVAVKDGADPLLVEAHKLIGDLLAGGMISVQSPLIWQRVKVTQEKLRAAISVTEPPKEGNEHAA